MKGIKRLFPYLKPYKSRIVFTLFLGILLSGVGVIAARLIKVVTDDIFVAKNQDLLLTVPLFFVGLYLVAGVIRFIHMFLLRYTGDQIAVDIRNDLQKKYAHLSLNFHADQTAGSLISKTMNDVNMLQLGLTVLADIVKEPFAVVGLVGYLLYANWRLTVMLILVTPFLILTSRSLGRSVRKYSHLMQEANEDFTGVTKETIDGIRVIKAFSLEKHMIDKFKKVGEAFLFTRKKILSREELVGPVFEFLASIIAAGLIFFIGLQIIKGRATTGDFISFLGVMGMLQTPIKKLQDAHVRIQHTIAACERVFEVLDTPILVKSPEELGRQPKSWPHDWQEIEFQNVGFSYGDKKILQNVNFKVKRGEVVAFVGASGAGKTTLVNLLPRFYDLMNGSIKIGGVDIRDFSLSELRRHMALVTQDVFLFNESVKENVAAGASIDSTRLKKALTIANADRFVEVLPEQDDSIVGDRGAKLSGGERQRISIARAVFKDAPILILDEATSSLDSQSELEVQNALDSLMAGRTTFVIAHRLSTIQRADHIFVLSEGHIVEQGHHQELLNKKGSYAHLYDLQFKNI